MSSFPVYALPGLLNDAHLWQHQAAGLKGRPLVTADLTGHDCIAALASSALASAPADRFALLGLSMGGYVALEIMRQAPERVVALALLDTNARPDSAAATENRKNLLALARTDFAAVVQSLTPRLVHPRHLGEAAIVGVIEAMAQSVGANAFERQQKAIMSRIDSRPFLSAIACPTLVLCGREDTLTPVELHEEMASAIVYSRLVVIEQCGHMSPLEQAQQVTEALLTWLSALRT